MRTTTCTTIAGLLLLAAGASLAADPPPAAAAAPAPSASKLPPVADFVRDDSFELVKISPTGTYIARSRNIPDQDGRTKRVLAVEDRLSGKLVGHFNLAGKTDVENFWWVNDHRLLISAGEKSGLLEQPRPTGELYGMNADGTDQGILIGYRAVTQQTGSHVTVGKRTEANRADMVDDLPDDDGHVIVAIWPSDGGGDSGFEKAARLDVKTGQANVVAAAPVRDADFKTDLKGEVRFATGSNQDSMTKTYYRDDAKSSWVLLNDEAVTKVILRPLGFGADGRTAYLRREDSGNGPDTLVAYDTTSHTMKDVLRDPVANPDPVVGPRGELIGVRYEDAKPRTVFLNEQGELEKAFRSLEASFADQAVVLAGFTGDGKRVLVYAYSDRSPGDYYLFDLESKKAVHLLSHRDWIDPDRMGEQHPVSFKARDGLTLHGFLTMPAGSNGKNLPLVIYPHGGPFDVADYWGFDGEVQLLASRGYAVLQVNYRGSDGFGRAFSVAGYGQWGGALQDDLTDATKWAIAQGAADPRRVCIFGGSYGGYAALMGVAKEPDLYRCAIGYVGIYDLPRWQNLEPMQSKKRTNVMKDYLGTGDLDALSPVHLADRIKVPVLLVAGAEDEIAVPAHTEMMRDALRKAGKPVEATIYPGEGHGFYLEADREAFWNSVLAFLDRNIGSGAH